MKFEKLIMMYQFFFWYECEWYVLYEWIQVRTFYKKNCILGLYEVVVEMPQISGASISFKKMKLVGNEMDQWAWFIQWEFYNKHGLAWLTCMRAYMSLVSTTFDGVFQLINCILSTPIQKMLSYHTCLCNGFLGHIHDTPKPRKKS